MLSCHQQKIIMQNMWLLNVFTCQCLLLWALKQKLKPATWSWMEKRHKALILPRIVFLFGYHIFDFVLHYKVLKIIVGTVQTIFMETLYNKLVAQFWSQISFCMERFEKKKIVTHSSKIWLSVADMPLLLAFYLFF